MKKNGKQPPEGLIITVSAGMIGHHGYRHWLRNFLDAMARNADGEDMYYWMRAGGMVKLDQHMLYVYLCIGGKIRYRCIYAGCEEGGTKTFDDGRTISAKAWILLAGPVELAPYPIKKQGFQGFRYTQKLF